MAACDEPPPVNARPSDPLATFRPRARGTGAGLIFLPADEQRHVGQEAHLQTGDRRRRSRQSHQAKVNNDTGKITGKVTTDGKDQSFSVTGPRPIPDAVEETLRQHVTELEFANASTTRG